MHPQLEKFKDRFLALQERERWVLASGAVLVLLMALYFLIFEPLNQAVSDRNLRVLQKQKDLAWMQSVAGQVSALGNVSGPGGGNESIVVLIANSANQSGVGNALTGQTPMGNNSVRVRLEGADFDALVLWIGRLQQQFGISVDNASIDRAAKPGQVNANLTFVRGNAPA